MTLDPPNNIDRSDIDHYVVYVPSRNLVVNGASATSSLNVPNCRNNVSIHVAAVNRFGCMGINSSEIQPSLFDVPTAEGGTTNAHNEGPSASCK